MPNPRPGESRDDFLDRCIPQVIEEGKEPDQAVAMCIAFYEGEKDKAFNIKDGEQIEYYKAFERRRESFEAKYTRVIQRAIRKQLEIYEEAETIQDLRKEITPEPIQEAYIELYSEVGDTFARLTWQGIKKMPYHEVKQETPIWIERMIAIAREDASDRIVGVNDETKRIINAIIVKGLEDGLSNEQIKRLIIGTTELPPLNGTLPQRARRIARTEIVSASNGGSLEGAKSTGIPFDKQWLATPDDNTRDSHENANGQTVDGRARFYVGNSFLSYPGDPKGPAKEVINCRCTQIYITPES